MNNKEFDKIVREKLNAFHEELDQSDLLWDSISSSLDVKDISKNRFRIRAKRVAFAISSVAAILIVALFITFAPSSTKPHINVAQSDFSQQESLQPKNLPIESNQNTVAVLAKTKTLINKTSPKTIQANINVSGVQYVAEVGDKETTGLLVVDSTQYCIAKDTLEVESINSSSLEVESRTETSKDSSSVTIQEAIDNLKHSYYALYDSDNNTNGYKKIEFRVSSDIGSTVNNGADGQESAMFAAGTGASAQVIEQVTDTKYSLPIGFGIQIRVELNKSLSLGIGANYSLLMSSYEGLINKQLYEIKQSLHYMGIPINLYVKLLNKNKFSCYANIGGTIEKGLSACYKMDSYNSTTRCKDPIDGFEFSANGGIGVEYKFTKFAGIYFEPNIIYYFNSKLDNSIKTNQPLQFRTELGFRFTL